MKEELPSILISDGWITNENDGLVEVVIPSTVDTYQAPTAVTSYVSAVNWLPNTSSTLTTLDLPNATSIPIQLSSIGVANLSLPKLITLRAAQFYNNKNLINVSLPELPAITVDEVFRFCTSLQNVVLGSVGRPITGISGAYNFNGCTQGGLTITIYTNNGASLSGAPWGATNATIVYKSA